MTGIPQGTVSRSSKSTVFISHANPEDNYFATWLATKLNLLGYEVWCDTEELKGGEDFWRDIERAIRTQTIKFLFVVTNRSLEKDGTRKELAVADRIKDHGDFIIPLRLEAVPHNTFPTEIIRLNAIEFSTNWATGLVQLVEKLESDFVPRKRSYAIDQIRKWWRGGIAPTNHGLQTRDERHWSNWFACQLPDKVYLHHLADTQIVVGRLPYPAILSGEWLITFACHECFGDAVSITRTEKVEVSDFLKSWKYEVLASHFTVKKTDAKITELINLAFNQYALNKGLLSYQLSEGVVMYFPPTLKSGTRVSRVKLDRYGLTHVSLVGESSGSKWHYGIQGRAILDPQPIVWISHHIVFTLDSIPLESAAQHKLRRKVGSDWYNKQWRDRLLAATLLLADDPTSTTITIPVCCSQAIKLDVEPVQFTSPMGYIDPV